MSGRNRAPKNRSITSGRQFSSIEAKFMASFTKGAETDCWPWLGPVNTNGYGRLYMLGSPIRSMQAHRFSYLHFVGKVQEGLVLDHLCRNRVCINPRHLEPVTDKVNFNRGIGAQRSREAAAARSHCGNGHPYAEFAFTDYRGTRKCRACERASFRRLRERRKAEREPQTEALA